MSRFRAHPWHTRPLSILDDTDDDQNSLPEPICHRHYLFDNREHEAFHELTKYRRETCRGLSKNILSYISRPSLIARSLAIGRRYEGCEAISLPKSEICNVTLATALSQRRSCDRSDLHAPIDLVSLATILHNSLRVNARTQIPGDQALTQFRRPYPSAGGLYPVEFYVATNEVIGLPQILGYYDPLVHEVRRLRMLPEHGIRGCEVARSEIELPPPCTVIVTSVIERTFQKYGPRGYRFALLEAGAAIQNLLLTACSLGQRALVSASFYETEVEGLLGIDGTSEVVIALVHLGANHCEDKAESAFSATS